jgi:hypothetical protein
MLDIDPASLGISLLALSAFIGPLYYYSKKLKQKLNSQKEFIKQLGQSNNLQFSELDFWRGLYAIGLDSNQRKLVYVNFSDQTETVVIDLEKVHKIVILKREHQLSNGKDKRDILDHLALLIDTFDQNHKLEFYDSEKFSDNDGEWPLIQKWHNMLKPLVKGKNEPEQAHGNTPKPRIYKNSLVD